MRAYRVFYKYQTATGHDKHTDITVTAAEVGDILRQIKALEPQGYRLKKVDRWSSNEDDFVTIREWKN